MKLEEAKRLGFSDNLWRMVELCWLEDYNTWPSIGDPFLFEGCYGVLVYERG
jgi:hypothetical protein